MYVRIYRSLHLVISPWLEQKIIYRTMLFISESFQVHKVISILVFCASSAFGAVLQGSLFGLAGILPASYTTPIMSGQGLAGAFAAFSMICALASMSHKQRTNSLLWLKIQRESAGRRNRAYSIFTVMSSLWHKVAYKWWFKTNSHTVTDVKWVWCYSEG